MQLKITSMTAAWLAFTYGMEFFTAVSVFVNYEFYEVKNVLMLY